MGSGDPAGRDASVALADWLTEQHHRQQDQKPGSFALLVTGPWGSGKSKIVESALEELKERDGIDDDWIVPDPEKYFHAWRESHVGVAWWSLLTWLRTTVHDSRRKPLAKFWFWLRELVHQLRVSGLIFAVFAVSLVVTVPLVGIAWRIVTGDWPPWVNALTATEFFVFVTVLIGTMQAVATLAARILSWRSPQGADFFRRRDDNPGNGVVRHVVWLRQRAGRSIVVPIEDLDRCSIDYVVDLLEAIGTLLRHDHGEHESSLIVVVAADVRWLHTAFEHRYRDFASAVETPGCSLGHLFLAKLFEQQFRPPTREMSGEGAVGDDGGGPDAAEIQATAAELAPLVDQPGATKRLVNALALHRKLDSEIGLNAAARWHVIELRWPELAERLRRDPGQLERWHDDGIAQGDPHLDVITSTDFAAVVYGDDGLALCSDDVRRCVGEASTIDLTRTTSTRERAGPDGPARHELS